MARNGTHSAHTTMAPYSSRRGTGNLSHDYDVKLGVFAIPCSRWRDAPHARQCELSTQGEYPMTRPFSSGCVGASLALALLAVSSAAKADFDASVIFGPIDACIDLALQQQEGIVLGWRLGNAQATAVDVDILAPDDRVWTIKCNNGKVGAPERKLGNKNYKMLKSRSKVPEKSARFTAV